MSKVLAFYNQYVWVKRGVYEDCELSAVPVALSVCVININNINININLIAIYREEIINFTKGVKYVNFNLQQLC